MTRRFDAVAPTSFMSTMTGEAPVVARAAIAFAVASAAATVACQTTATPTFSSTITAPASTACAPAPARPPVVPDPSYVPRTSASMFDAGCPTTATNATTTTTELAWKSAQHTGASVYDAGFGGSAPANKPASAWALTPTATANAYDAGAPTTATPLPLFAGGASAYDAGAPLQQQQQAPSVPGVPTAAADAAAARRAAGASALDAGCGVTSDAQFHVATGASMYDF